MVDLFREMIGKEVKKFFLVVWPPYGEDDFSQIDISAGYLLADNPNGIFVVSTDKNDLSTPIASIKPIPKKSFGWHHFEDRMQKWMSCSENMEFDTEYYDVSDFGIFSKIVGNIIQKVEIIQVNQPIGIKISFKSDFVLSIPNNDGNTIETANFNKKNIMKNLLPLGEIRFINV